MLVRMILFILFGVIILNCSSSKKSEDTIEEQQENFIHFDVKKKVLSNGLTILVVENNKLPLFSFYSYYKVGGKYEKKGTTGASHFLEHMMFKGAKKYGPGAFDRLVEGNGGQNNAFTSNDLTVYYETLPSEHFNIIADLEADRMANLLLDPESFEKERLVVLEERRMRYENSDRGKLYLSMMKEVFRGTPYGKSVIGEAEDLKALTRDDVQKYFKQFYAPNNAVVVVVGQLKSNDVFKVMEEKFGKIPANPELIANKKNLTQEGFEFKKKLSGQIRLKGSSPTSNFMMAFKALKTGVKDAFVLDILASILGEGESSYLSKKFVLGRKSLLQNIYAANFSLDDSGVFFIGGQLTEKTQLKNWIRTLKKEVSGICEKSITQRAVKKVINNYLFSVVSKLDNNAGIARYIGDREVHFGSYEFYKKEFSIYNSIKIDDLKRVCRQYLTVNDSVFISIGK